MLIDSLETPTVLNEPIFTKTDPFLTFETNPPSFCEGLLLQTPKLSQSTSSSGLTCIPQAPRSTRNQNVKFFLNFHRETITGFHYFRYDNYQKRCTRTLLAMAERSDALRYAVVAFSALIYSMNVDRTAREQAFLYYAMSLQQLRVLLDDRPMNTEENHTAIATALQLSAFDVYSDSYCG